MKTLHLLALPAIAFGSFSCTSIDGVSETSAIIEEGVPGGEFAETTTITATVTGIDASKRELTFVSPKGKKFRTVAGAEVLNFEQIKIGDQLKATLTDEVTVRMAKPEEQLSEYATFEAEMAKRNAKPGMQTVETSQAVATITDINTKRRKVKLTFSDGKSKRVKVRSDIDLSAIKVGDRVVIRVTETVAIGLEKP
ncbi:MAG: hypothetical protein AAGI48_04335 [Verrucomicrobiota bacterium]